MIASIEPFYQCCTQGKPCGVLIKTEGSVHHVQRYAVVVSGEKIILRNSVEEAREFILKKGWSLAAS